MADAKFIRTLPTSSTLSTNHYLEHIPACFGATVPSALCRWMHHPWRRNAATRVHPCEMVRGVAGRMEWSTRSQLRQSLNNRGHDLDLDGAQTGFVSFWRFSRGLFLISLSALLAHCCYTSWISTWFVSDHHLTIYRRSAKYNVCPS